MGALSEALRAVETRRKTLELHTDREELASEFERQFSSRNVRVVHEPLRSGTDRGFIILRDEHGKFRGAVSADHFEAILSPDVHPPWTIEESDVDEAALFDFLDNTVFTSYSRRQMLAAAREIEDRAWRTGAGALYVGFQNAAAFESQVSVYERLVRGNDLDATIFIEDDWGRPVNGSIDVVAGAGSEIGQFWFVIFDGAGSGLNKCGLVAEERDGDRYYGFWTYDPERVDGIVSFLDDIVETGRDGSE